MPGHTALLVVHGIGAQKRGDTIEKLARGLRLVDPGFAPLVDGTTISATVGGRPVRLYEVYWADLLMGDATRGTFLLNELQSLCWFPLFNLRCGQYRSRNYSFVKLAWWCVALPIFNFFALFAYYGAGLFAQIFAGDQGKRAKGTLRQQISDQFAKKERTPTAVDRMLDEYAGDVVNYVNSAGNAFFREKDERQVPPEIAQVFPNIMQRFHEQLLRAEADGCDTIQVVAHSLGTVVTWHALSGFGDDPRRADAASVTAARTKVTRVYTIGSPLEKIRFFWPRVTPAPAARGATNFRWDNFVSYFDPVSGMLRTYDDWGPVTNHRLLGGGFILGHVVYEHSAVFLGALTEGLCGRSLPMPRTLKQRLRDAVVLVGETLAAPLALIVVLAVGAGLFVVAAMFVPYLASWLVRWFVPAETWAPIVDAASLIFLGMMILTFLVAPAVRAGKAHARYWVIDARRR
jgi:hypothetical protein